MLAVESWESKAGCGGSSRTPLWACVAGGTFGGTFVDIGRVGTFFAELPAIARCRNSAALQVSSAHAHAPRDGRLIPWGEPPLIPVHAGTFISIYLHQIVIVLY